MAIYAPQFIHTYTLSGTSTQVSSTYDLPALAYDGGYEIQVTHTSIPLQMADGSTKWQTFLISGSDASSGNIYTFTLKWAQLTTSNVNVLMAIFGVLSRIDGSATRGTVTFRDPYGTVWTSVKRHPEQKDLVTPVYASGGVLYRSAELKLVQDTA